jgi:hypothetical protein
MMRRSIFDHHVLQQLFISSNNSFSASALSERREARQAWLLKFRVLYLWRARAACMASQSLTLVTVVVILPVIIIILYRYTTKLKSMYITLIKLKDY